MRTQGAFWADTAHGGGLFFYGAENINLQFSQQGVAAGSYAWVRNALGDVSLNNTAGVSTVPFWLGLADLKRRLETSALAQKNLPFQNKFGTAALTPSVLEAPQSLPPFTGNSQLGPFTNPVSKGVQINDVFAVYSVQTAALTAATLGVTRTLYAENTTLAVTTVLAATNIALTTTTAANSPHVQIVSIVTPSFEISDLTNTLVELTITTAATSLVRVYGIGCHVNLNYD